MHRFLLGFICMGYLASGVFFLRFWARTRDRFFVFFALSLFLLAFSRFLQGLGEHLSDASVGVYLIRLAAFLLIFVAFIDKNRRTA